MNSIRSISLSGMNAATVRLNASAHNVANAGTPDFRRQTVTQSTQPGGGVGTQLVQSGAAGSDLAADAVAQMSALYDFKANLRTLLVEREMLGSLLDTRA